MRRLAGLIGSLLALVAALTVGGAPVAAQAACVADTEPNDQPSIAIVHSGELCVDGTLATGDQDLFAWEVGPADASTGWTFGLTGVEDALTTLQLLRIASDPGVEPPTPDTTPLLTIETGPDVREATPREDVLVTPGRYLVAVFRSGSADDLPDAAVDYHVAITRGAPLPAPMDGEPNDDAASGTPTQGAFAGSGDLAGSDDHIRWTPDPADPEALWALALRVPLGASVRMTLTTSDGLGWRTVTTVDGSAVLRDLGADPDGYDITLSHIDDAPLPWVLSAALEPTGGPVADPEPNDQGTKALVIDPAHPVVRGRLASDGDVDVWRLTIDEALATRQLDIRLLSPDAPARQLCLTDTAELSLQCRTDVGGVALSNLLLPVGEYLLRVTGDADPDAGYLLRVDTTSAPVADYETEPNDTPATATRFDAGLVMRGRSTDGDADVYRLTVGGEPQLWQVEARGPDLSTLLWVDGAGYTLGTGIVADDRASATLHDLYLVPGEHRIWVAGEGGDYTLSATPMGPPDPDAEREPNDEQTRANRISVGDTRTGRLRARDADWYRFSLTATEHIVVDVDVPEDAAIVLELMAGGQTLAETRGTGVGQDIRYDTILPAGEYAVWLYPTQPSDAAYRLDLRRADPFARAGDLEPNDNAATARALPSSGVIEGTGWGVGDQDWYRLPAQPGGRLAIEVEGAVAFVELVQGETAISLRQEETDGATWSTDEAPAGDGFLVVTALGDHTIRLPGARDPSETGPALAVDVTLTTDTVAAWWDAGQRVAGTVRVTNRTQEPQDVTLDAWASDDHWRVSLDAAPASALGAGASVDVPVTVEVPARAWADTPVAVGVRAGLLGDEGTFGWTTVTPTGDASPVDPHRWWAVPDALLGGLDVASVMVGGVSDGAIDPAGELLLHDGMAIGGGSLTLPVTDPVTATTVDLAGDVPVPVVGIIIDPASAPETLTERPRDFELWLSEDGSAWTSALTGEIGPPGVDQPFVLPTPVPARYARLAITSTWEVALLGPGYTAPQAQVAEWKVIAAPGVDPVDGARDIADAALGGHVVWSDPLLSEMPDVATTMLDADLTATWVFPPEGGTVSWVVGFLHDRAAQMIGLEWADPVGSEAPARARRVTVEVSTESPLGPWTSLGTWRLQRADDGTVAPFTLDTPVWARFVRFGAPGPRAEGAKWELPGQLRILERPTDDEYRSILAEWGQSRPEGPFELLVPETVGAGVDDPDVGEGDEARPLAPGTRVAGRVAIGSDADEYLVEVPDGQHSIHLEVGGEPVVGVRLHLVGPDGAEVPLAFSSRAATGDLYSANVTPGTTYRVRVEQPPFSAVLMYDTSLSIAGYWGPIRQGLMAFAGDVVRGRDRVMIIPFGENGTPLVRDWSDDAWQLQAALEGSIADGDSSTEASVLRALEVLEARQGARAILLVTDGDSPSFPDGTRMWQRLARQQPLVFTVHIGGTPGSSAPTHLLQDLAASAGGVYTYVRTQDEMDRAFDQMATTLRRPAGYQLSYETSAESLPPPEPGALRVVTQTGPDGQPVAAPVDSRIAIEIILDTSSSMRAKLGRTTRIDAAKEVLDRLVREELPPDIPVALRWFRQARGSCDTELAVPLGPLDREAMASTIEGIRLRSGVRTPLAAAIEAVADDLASVTGPRIVVVLSDGQESCKGDPEAAVRALREQGYDVTINVVGLGLDREDRRRIRRLARLGGGSYFDARGAGQLEAALGAAVSAPFEVRDATGELVARGIVNGPTIELPPGTYQVSVLTDPPYQFEAIVLESGSGATLTLPMAPTAP